MLHRVGISEEEMVRLDKILAKDDILFRLTGKFVTDYSDASGTNCLDLNRL